MRGVGVTRVVTEGNCTPHGSPVETTSPGATNTASPGTAPESTADHSDHEAAATAGTWKKAPSILVIGSFI